MLSKVIVKKNNEVIATYDGTCRSMQYTFSQWIDYFKTLRKYKRTKNEYLIELFNEDKELIKTETYVK